MLKLIPGKPIVIPRRPPAVVVVVGAGVVFGVVVAFLVVVLMALVLVTDVLVGVLGVFAFVVLVLGVFVVLVFSVVAVLVAQTVGLVKAYALIAGSTTVASNKLNTPRAAIKIACSFIKKFSKLRPAAMGFWQTLVKSIRLTKPGPPC